MRENAYRLIRKGGFIPAMPLVLDAERKFDEEGQRRLVRYYLEAGADGIMMAEPLAGVLSPDMMAEFSAPYVKRIVDGDFCIL